MTLLVAAKQDGNVWMAADSAITGNGSDLREREYAIKIIPSRDQRALIGFSGDAFHGRSLAEAAAAEIEDEKRIRLLIEGQGNVPSVEFAYTYKDISGPHLICITDEEAQERPTLHLGLSDAFEQFQRIRHDSAIDHVPEALKTFLAGSRSSEIVPTELCKTIVSMLRLFAERSERGVGGWVTPYFLTSEGAFLCEYGYAVSDPILTKIQPGSSVPHGTAENGGFALSVTELGDGQGVIVYWLQRPGGMVFLRGGTGYEILRFEGRPAKFIECASVATGLKVQIMFSDQPHGPANSITVIRDENGIPSVAIARSGRAFSLSVLNVAAPFRSNAAINFADPADPDEIAEKNSPSCIKTQLSDDLSALDLTLLSDDQSAAKASLTTNELDLVIATLVEKRWLMRDPVPVDYQQAVIAGTIRRELLAVNPAWRTELPIHPALDGITLRLRHPGFGWVNFLLPWHEAKALGEWLAKNSPPGVRSA